MQKIQSTIYFLISISLQAHTNEICKILTNSSIINDSDSQNLVQIYSMDTRRIEIQWSNDFEVANRVAPSYSMQRSNPQGPAAADHYLNEFPKPMVKT